MSAGRLQPDSLAWSKLMRTRSFAAGRFKEGVSFGIAAISDLLATHYPPPEGNANELPNEPVVL